MGEYLLFTGFLGAAFGIAVTWLTEASSRNEQKRQLRIARLALDAARLFYRKEEERWRLREEFFERERERWEREGRKTEASGVGRAEGNRPRSYGAIRDSVTKGGRIIVVSSGDAPPSEHPDPLHRAGSA